MSRTFRNYQTWTEWLDNFGDRLRRGLVNIPKLRAKRDGRLGIDEIWGRNKKRFRRKLIKRARRRRDKELIRNLMQDGEVEDLR